MGLRALLLPLLLALAPLGATAQDARPPVQSPILTIDVDRLLAETLFGQRLEEDLLARTEAFAAENERLRAELTAEERSLTERRPAMEVDAFRAEADAFDARVQGIRAEQDRKQQALEASVDRGRQEFLNAVTPVLGRLMIDRGAAVILERREVFLSASVVDVTEEAIAAIDAQLGDGTAAPQPAAPEETAPPEAVAAPEGSASAPAALSPQDPPAASPAPAVALQAGEAPPAPSQPEPEEGAPTGSDGTAPSPGEG